MSIQPKAFCTILHDTASGLHKVCLYDIFLLDFRTVELTATSGWFAASMLLSQAVFGAIGLSYSVKRPRS